MFTSPTIGKPKNKLNVMELIIMLLIDTVYCI